MPDSSTIPQRVATAETPPDSPPREQTPAATVSQSADRTRLSRGERAILEARVAALERALERRDRRLYRVIEQYERLLAERGGRKSGGAVEIEIGERNGLFGRLRSLLG